jgi:hypothetical protein
MPVDKGMLTESVVVPVGDSDELEATSPLAKLVANPELEMIKVELDGNGYGADDDEL